METEDLSWFDLIIGSIPFFGNGYMIISIFIKLREQKRKRCQNELEYKSG